METTIRIPYWITRNFIKAHPNWIFLYGGSAFGHSSLGQAAVAEDMRNTYEIPVRKKLCQTTEAYWHDYDFDLFHDLLVDTFDSIPYTIAECVIPFPKIGQGFSNLKGYSPRCFTELQKWLKDFQKPEHIIRVLNDGTEIEL